MTAALIAAIRAHCYQMKLVPGHYTFYDFSEALSGGMLTIMAAGFYGAVTALSSGRYERRLGAARALPVLGKLARRCRNSRGRRPGHWGPRKETPLRSESWYETRCDLLAGAAHNLTARPAQVLRIRP
jgi:hypothetical protein